MYKIHSFTVFFLKLSKIFLLPVEWSDNISSASSLEYILSGVILDFGLENKISRFKKII